MDIISSVLRLVAMNEIHWILGRSEMKVLADYDLVIYLSRYFPMLLLKLWRAHQMCLWAARCGFTINPKLFELSSKSKWTKIVTFRQ